VDSYSPTLLTPFGASASKPIFK